MIPIRYVAATVVALIPSLMTDITKIINYTLLDKIFPSPQNLII